MLMAACVAQDDYELSNFVKHPEMLIITVLAGTANKYDKGYCFPSQDKILALLARYGRRMSRASLNCHLNQFIRMGWIERRRRHQRDGERGWVFRSTMYKLKARALKWLAGMAGAANRAAAFLSTSRVRNSGNNYLHKRIIPEAHPKNGCAPPGSLSECCAGDPGGMTNKKKDDRLIGRSDPETAAAHLSQMRRLLNV